METRTVSVEEELVLLLAGTADRRTRAEARMRALAATASFDAIGALLLRQRLALILGPRAQALDLTIDFLFRRLAAREPLQAAPR